MTRVVVIDTGVANLASIESALERAGARVTRAADPVEASHLVLPGVGSFATGMARLCERGWDAAIAAHDGPLLGVCLGLQLLADGSEEAPGVRGLGVLPARVAGLGAAPSLPQLGWNRVDGMVEAGHAAFANSFALTEVPDGWRGAWARHGAAFVAALERGKTLACQFHPELSGAFGATILERWLAGVPCVRGGDEQGRGRLAVRVIPCLDVRDGKVVKGVRFQGLREVAEPAEAAARYAAEGADEIVLLDVAASPRGDAPRLATIREVRATLSIPLTVGGGLRTVEDAGRLLAAGADKVAVNSAALARPALIGELAARFGSQCTVLAVDARRTAGGGWEALTHGGRRSSERDAIAWIREGVALGAGEILLTSWDRDGTGEGADLELLRRASEAVRVPIVASGGIARAEQGAAAVASGADAVLAASIFHDRTIRVDSFKRALSRLDVEVRA